MDGENGKQFTKPHRHFLALQLLVRRRMFTYCTVRPILRLLSVKKNGSRRRYSMYWPFPFPDTPMLQKLLYYRQSLSPCHLLQVQVHLVPQKYLHFITNVVVLGNGCLKKHLSNGSGIPGVSRTAVTNKFPIPNICHQQTNRYSNPLPNSSWKIAAQIRRNENHHQAALFELKWFSRLPHHPQLPRKMITTRPSIFSV